MKKNIFKSALLAVSTVLLLTACESDPEVGSTLYPSMTDASTPVAYIDNHSYVPKNIQANIFVQKGTSTELDTDGCELKFKIHLTIASNKDLVFNLKQDNAKIPQAYAESHEALKEDAFTVAKGTVTVKAGKLESEDEFDIKLDAASKSLIGVEDGKKMMAAFTVEAPTEVTLSKKYNAYCWEVSKKIFWVNPKGSTKGMEQLDVNTYDVNAASYGNIGPNLSDGKDDSYQQYMVSNSSTSYLKIDLKKETDIKALQLTPCGSSFFGDLNELFVREIEIFGSTADKGLFQMTDADMVQLGVATCPAMPKGPNDKWDIVFYGPQKVRHIWVRMVSAFSDSSSAFINELRIFK